MYLPIGPEVGGQDGPRTIVYSNTLKAFQPWRRGNRAMKTIPALRMPRPPTLALPATTHITMPLGAASATLPVPSIAMLSLATASEAALSISPTDPKTA